VGIVGAGDRVSFAPPTTLRLKIAGPRADLFANIEDLLREIA